MQNSDIKVEYKTVAIDLEAKQDEAGFYYEGKYNSWYFLKDHEWSRLMAKDKAEEEFTLHSYNPESKTIIKMTNFLKIPKK
jgi:hypothetical protein